jgi:hypothetical protein
MAIQRMRVLVAPSMRDLLLEPLFEQYMKRRPRLPLTAQHGSPWRILARRTIDDERTRWAIREHSSYDSAYRQLVELAQGDVYDDVTLISKRRLFQPPMNYVWERPFDWCGRCRRPTLFRLSYDKHPGVHTKGAAVSLDDPVRCVLCGVRRSFLPNYEARFSDHDG